VNGGTPLYPPGGVALSAGYVEVNDSPRDFGALPYQITFNAGATQVATVNYNVVVKAQKNESFSDWAVVYNTSNGQIAPFAWGTWSLNVTAANGIPGTGVAAATGVGSGPGSPASVSAPYMNALTTSGSVSFDTTSTVTIYPVLQAVAGGTIPHGGNTIQGTITMTSNVQPNVPAVLSLTSDNTKVQIPSTVTVASGNSTANFTISSTAVTTQVTATISAAYGSAPPVTCTVTVNP
jgi:hypothetical protein